MSKSLKKGQFTFTANQPMKLSVLSEDDRANIPEEEQELIRSLGDTIEAYVNSGQELVKGKYNHLADIAPPYLANPGNVLVISCIDGIIIRYEINEGEHKIYAGWIDRNLQEMVPVLSQQLIHCHPERPYSSTVSETGTEITLSSASQSGEDKHKVMSFRIGYDVVLSAAHQSLPSPYKPTHFASIRNSLELGIHGKLMEQNVSLEEGRDFLIRVPIRLPVGWECIEIFPRNDPERWSPENARFWAENDILAAVVADQFKEAKYESLDPLATARERIASLLEDFKRLLDSDPKREEVLQQYLRENPVLLCPQHTRMWPKLPFGKNISDFVFRQASGDYLLIELEKSTHSLFRNDGHPREELNVALGQITDWKRYIEDNLGTVQNELGLSGITASPQSFVVIGRSRSLSLKDRRKLKSMESERRQTKILTYDDLYENAKAVTENLLGPLWNATGETRIYYPKR